MSLDTCDRCGATLPGDATLCGDCSAWLADRPALTEADVLECTRFQTPPVLSLDRVVIGLGLGAIFLLPSFLLISWALLDCVTAWWSSRPDGSSTAPIWIAFLAATLGLGATIAGPILARSRPWPALWIVLGSVSLSLLGQLSTVTFAGNHTVDPFIYTTLIVLRESTLLVWMLVLHAAAVATLGYPLWLLFRRRRQLADARARLADRSRQ